ncbi:MAG: cystathionine beta-lyase [Rhizobacter sp.]
MSDSKPLAPSTSLIHHPYQPPEGFQAVNPGVHKASTVIFENTAALKARQWKDKTGYTYGLHGTPTSFTLEARIASLEGGRDTLLAPSGLAAIALINFAFLQAGDEVLIPNNAYGPNKALAQNELAGWGITAKFYDAMEPQSLRALLSPKSRLVWLEAAGSVTMEFPDLPALVRICRDHGVLTAIDNTWGAGIAFNPFQLGDGLGVDVSMQALTKYPSGGGDVLMGSVTTVNEDLRLRLAATHMRLGFGVGGNDVELLLRSLLSIGLRYAAHDAAARTLAAWWAKRPEVAAVLHPAWPTSPGHANWAALCTQAAGLFSVVFDERYSVAQVDAFVDALQLFKIGFSWAGPISLVMPYDLRLMRDQPAWRGTLVRFSVGLEAVGDLVADCERALVESNLA